MNMREIMGDLTSTILGKPGSAHAAGTGWVFEHERRRNQGDEETDHWDGRPSGSRISQDAD
jgi:hypothetical protein